MRLLAASRRVAALWLGDVRRACSGACFKGVRRSGDLLASFHRVAPDAPLAGVLLWWAWEELQVILCSAWFIFDPWPIDPGQAMCSAKLGFDLGALGVLIVAVLALRLNLSDLTASNDRNGERK